MGSPISLVITNIFVEHFEKEVLRKTFKKPEVWFHYVDNTFIIWRHSRAEFLIFLNNQHPNIHFTMDIEKNGKLPFLNVLVSKKADGTLDHQVYRKLTHTDRYLHESHHLAQKQSTINSLVHRDFTIYKEISTDRTQSLKNSLTEKRTRQKRYNQNNQ